MLTLFSFCLSRLTPFWFRHLTGWLGCRPKSWNFRARNRPRHCQRQKSDAQAAAAPPRSILCSSLLTLCLVLFLRVQKCSLSTSILAPKLRLKVNASHVFDVHRSARCLQQHPTRLSIAGVAKLPALFQKDGCVTAGTLVTDSLISFTISVRCQFRFTFVDAMMFETYSL